MKCNKCGEIIPENLDHCPKCKSNETLDKVPTVKEILLSYIKIFSIVGFSIFLASIFSGVLAVAGFTAVICN